MEFDSDFEPLDDDPVESASGGSDQERLRDLNSRFEVVLTNLEAIRDAFVEMDEDEGREEIDFALEHAQEAWASRNRKLGELAAS